jgi:branched-chain amino acid transport system ATP-binding protein
MEAVLDADNISIVFGGLRAVSDFNFSIREGELVGLIGPNGAGKTTVFNMLSGVYSPTSGEINFMGRDGRETRLNGLAPYQITKLGIARTFQNIRLYKQLSVLDNVRIAHHQNVKYNSLDAILRTKRFYTEETKIEAEARELLAIFGIDDKRAELASNLPYGQQRKLEIVRALATNPSLLLLDEPAAGMNPQETNALMDLIAFIRKKFNLTILLIEHDMSLVMGICERIVVLDYGKIISEGVPDVVRKDPLVIKAYLGQEAIESA